MPVTINAAVGHAAANSYVLLADATTYLEGRLNAEAWGSDTDKQNRALVEAARTLQNLSWKGSRTSDTQALTWPRRYVENVDTYSQLYYDENAIPQRVKDAQCELALEFLKAGSTDIAAQDPDANVKSTKVDVIETEFIEASQRLTGVRRFPRVHTLIAVLLERTGTSFERSRG